MRLVLGEDVDPPDPGIDAVGQREVDDPEDSPEGDGGLGSYVGERSETLSLPACHHECQRSLP